MADPAAVADDQGWIDVPNPAPAQSAASQGATDDSGWQDVPNPGPQPQPPPEKTPLGFAKNVLTSGKNLLTNVGGALMHPKDTSDALFDTLYGYGRQVRRNLGMTVADDEEGRKADQARDAFWNYVKSRYSSGDKFRDAFYNDPAGVAADLSTAFSGLGEAADAARMGTAAKVLTKAGEVANPLYVPSKVVSGALGHFMPKAPAPPPEAPPFDPATASFGNEFDPATGTFGEGQPLKFTTQPQPQRTGPLSQEDVERLRAKWGVKPPKTGMTEPGQPSAPPPKPQAPPPEPASAASATPAPPGSSSLASRVRNTALDLGVGAATEYFTHSLLGMVGGTAASATLRYLPEFLRSSTGQRLLSRIGPGSKAADIAAVARDVIPAYNAMYRHYIASQQQPQQQAKGGPISPELARVQRERLGPGAILGALTNHQ